ncbi:MAG TPA: PilT/PilU family type 4a pilus ATPase [Acidimicrobiales bacterium]|nr:PilT/PilU family type 4a pilus ATPase [Acidimicrobiales bacterium]
MSNRSRHLGEFLVERKVLSREDLEMSLQKETADGQPLPAILMSAGLVGEKDLVAAIADQVGTPFIDLAEQIIPVDLDRCIPAELAHKHLAVAVDVDADQLVVAMADPTDKDATVAITSATGWAVKPAVAVRSELQRVVTSMYGQPPSAAPATSPTGEPMEISEEPTVHGGWDDGGADELHVNELLQRVLDLGGSDLHLTNGSEPVVRVNGELKRLTEFPVLNGSEIRRMIFAILTQKQRERFESDKELDTSHSIPGLGRFRVNVFLQRDAVGSVMRVIPYEIVPLEDLGLPPAVAQLAELPRGLVLVTGPTGSGKSTTLASLIDIINRKRPHHIMTVEDPIEFLHHHKMSVVNQREVGEDTQSFAQALKHVLRQDPDVILVGEMRDLETIHMALSAAETGHIVYGTLHTQDAPQSVDRIIDVFPANQQGQVRVQLATALQGIVTQQLLPTPDGKGRAVAAEVMIATPAIRNLIREGKTHQIYSAMQAGAKYGMQTMDQSLANLVKIGKITMATALERCANQEDLRRLSGES